MMNVNVERISDAERAAFKELHSRIRKDMNATLHGWKRRSLLLLWGYVRGFPFKRIERTNRTPLADRYLYTEWFVTDWKEYLSSITTEEVDAWLRNPNGAIPVPPPREKKKTE